MKNKKKTLLWGQHPRKTGYTNQEEMNMGCTSNFGKGKEKRKLERTQIAPEPSSRIGGKKSWQKVKR